MARNFQDYTGAYAVAGAQSATIVGSTFQSITGGEITHLWWRRGDTDPGHKPTHLGVFDTSTGILLVDLVAFTDDGAVGWQSTELAEPIPINAGRSYSVMSLWPAGFFVFNPTPYAEPTAPYPLTWGSNKRAFKVQNTFTWAAPTQDNNGWYAVDASVTPGTLTPGDPGALPEDIENSLASWLDPADATQPGSNPKLYPRAMAKIDAVDFAAFIGQIGDIWDIAGVLADLEIAAANAVYAQIRTWLGWTADNDTALRRPDGTNVLDDTQAILTGNAALEAQLNTMQAQLTSIVSTLAGLGGSIGAFPTGWTLLAETPWVGSITFNEPAHLYVVNVTTPPSHGGQVDVEGLLWLPRLGWWAELNATQLGSRGFLEFGTQQLHANGRAMAGILLKAKPDAEGTIQAWGAP